MPDPTANFLLQERAIRHAVFLEGFKNRLSASVGSALADELDEIAGSIFVRLERNRSRGFGVNLEATQGLRDTRAMIRDRVTRATRAARDSSASSLQDLAKGESAFAEASIRSAAPISVELALPASATLRSIVSSRPFQGAVLRDWFSGLSVSAQKDIERQVNIGIAAGESNADIVRRLRGGRNFPGVFQTSRRNAESIVRTAANHVSAHGREALYAENPDLVKAVKIVATLDLRTTLICAGLDGQVFPILEGPRPPFHFNCRTTTSPILASLTELGLSPRDFPPSTRASMNGQVPESTTFGDFLKRQSRADQDAFLGPRRASLWREGKVSIQSFTDSRQMVLNLDQILAREGIR